MKVFSVETPVYYDDGESLMGVFFESEHRIYIDYEDIPKDFVNALIAAEDKNFFRHPGLDPLSVLRAAYVNFRDKKKLFRRKHPDAANSEKPFQKAGQNISD